MSRASSSASTSAARACGPGRRRPTRSEPVAGNVTQLADRPAPARLGELGAALDAVLVAAAPLGRVRGMAIAVPGLVAGSTCRWVPNLPYLDGVDLAAITAHVRAVGNDAHFALLAEATEGAAYERADACCWRSAPASARPC